jgi:membrane-associated protein
VDLLSPERLIETFGTLGIILTVFAESGLFFGFFLPGDSLLFTAGVLAARGTLNLPVLLVGVVVAAIAGDQVGYVFGRRVGPALFRRPDSRFFRREHVERAHDYFKHHGVKTIVLARFIPIVRTFAPIVAGVSQMRYRTFVTFNVVGGFLWGVGVTTAGYLLGEVVDIDRYLLPVIGLIVLISLTPVLLEMRKARRGSRDEVGSSSPR